MDLAPLPDAVLPPGIRSRFVPDINGLRIHILDAGYDDTRRPCVLLLHGFPELAYSWRKVMRPLADAGFHVVAPDLRGYGRTTGWSADYDSPDDLRSFRLLNAVRDALGLVHALGHRSVAAVVGHDFGSPVAAWCALVRPDVFRSVALMSAPFAGPPEPVAAGAVSVSAGAEDIHAALARLDPPRKHYQWYFTTRAADADMRRPPRGLHDFLRAYYHHKSGDWPGNRPFPLAGWTATELAKLPTYYVMELGRTMPETVAAAMPSAAEIAACAWLPDSELAVYAGEYARTGFQGGLNWYRCRVSGRHERELGLFAGRAIEVPATFIAGARDWGIEQVPGAMARMRDHACARMDACHLVPGAGHWVQQERPAEVVALLLRLLGRDAG